MPVRRPGSTTSSPSSSTRYATPRDHDRPTRGDITVAHLARLTRRAPYPWQWDVAQVAGELNETLDGFRYPIVVLSVPRRAGKSTLDLAVNLDHLDLMPDARCWYTCANGREVAAKLFRDEWAPMLAPLSRLYSLRKSQGSEGVHKRRGSSRLQLFAPTPTALHSTNVDTATVDEAFDATIEEGEAIESGITPAQLTRPWRQTWLVSAGGTIESTWWDRWLTTGEQGLPGVAMFDYGADPSDPSYDPAKPEVWARAHPTAGRAFPISVLEDLWARRSDDASFERAYLNVWPRPSSVLAAAGLDLDQWRAAAHPANPPDQVEAIALDVSRDRSSAAIAVAGHHDGRLVVEVVEDRPGVAWVANVARALRRQYRGVPLVADSLVAAGIVAELTRRGDRHTHWCVRTCPRLRRVRRPSRLWHRVASRSGRPRRRRRRRRAPPARRCLVVVAVAVEREHRSARRAVTLAAWAASTTPRRGRGEVVTSAPVRNGRPRPPSRPAIGRQTAT